MAKKTKDTHDQKQAKRAAIYIRVSTQEQTEGYSLDAQEAKLKNYCEIMGFDVYRIYIDPGYSGSNLKRPAISQMINEMDNFDVVLVYKLDRLSRSQKDTLHLIEDVMLPNDVDLISLSESFDTSTPFGRAMIGILSVFAQLERENIRDRMMMGKTERAISGKHNGSRCPIGYDFIDGELIKNEIEAMQLLKVAEMYISGKPIKTIFEYVKINYRTKYGSYKSNQTIYNILFNHIYRGFVNYSGEVYPGTHEVIFDESISTLIDEERNRRDRMNNGKSHVFQAKYLFTGIIYCGHCGSKYFAQNVSTKHNYICYTRSKSCKHMMKAESCSNKYFETNDFDALILNEIRQITTDPNKIKKISSVPTIHEDNTGLIKSKLKDIDSQVNKLLDLYQVGEVPAEMIRYRVDILNKERNSLKLTLSELEIKNKTTRLLDLNVVRDTAFDLITNFDLYDLSHKRKLVTILIRKITIDNEEVHIDWTF